MAKVSGYIREIKVDIGDRVAEGQLLATLEIPEMQDDLTRANAATIEGANADLAAARDELQRDESAHEMAHVSYTRILEVSKRERGLVPQQEVDEVHSRDLVAEAQVSAAKSRIAACEQRIRVSEAEQGRGTKTMYRYARISAPFAGVVTKRYANIGSLIQAGGDGVANARRCRWCRLSAKRPAPAAIARRARIEGSAPGASWASRSTCNDLSALHRNVPWRSPSASPTRWTRPREP